jgi:hypothetical protein
MAMEIEGKPDSLREAFVPHRRRVRDLGVLFWDATLWRVV